MTESFPSKILLFGEYSIIRGGSGLAIPYSTYSGALQIGSLISELDEGINTELVEGFNPEPVEGKSLLPLFHHLQKNSDLFPFIHLEKFKHELQMGLWFNSNIPEGYGLGSSGALVAALYDRFHISEPNDLFTLKNHLAALESFFHGSSSGIDPMVAYLKKAIMLRSNSPVTLNNWNINSLGLSVFLVDTGVKSKTLQLVDWFKAKMEQERFRQATAEDYFRFNEQIIHQVEKNESIDLANVLAISRYQLEYLNPMIPESFRKHFFDGLNSRDFAFKLCGSGGGGYMLCFANDAAEMKNYFSIHQLKYEQVV